MKIESPKNANYCAVVVALKTFVMLANCDNVKAALIFGNSVIVGKDAEAGQLGLFFSVETAISKEFLGANNQFRKPEWGNVDHIDPHAKGFFEESGRVKAMKFRGHKSEGFWIPLSSLAFTGIPLDNFKEGMEFDQLGDTPICTKYIPKRNHSSSSTQGVKTGRVVKLKDRIVEDQFRLHYDTANLRRNIDQIQPHTYITVTDKWHGTSAVFANILIKRELPWYEHLLKRLGVSIMDQQYGIVHSSRSVVKSVDGKNEHSNHYYGTDVWAEVLSYVKDALPKGYTVYGEIVGYTADGKQIQKGYHYGCEPDEHDFVVYRVTSTNADGKVLELTHSQMVEFCTRAELEMVKTEFIGKASEILPKSDVESLSSWQDRLLKVLSEYYVNDEMCPFNNLEVPAEGIVVKVDGRAEAYKLKNFKFLEWETKQNDAGVLDVETEESLQETC